MHQLSIREVKMLLFTKKIGKALLSFLFTRSTKFSPFFQFWSLWCEAKTRAYLIRFSALNTTRPINAEPGPSVSQSAARSANRKRADTGYEIAREKENHNGREPTIKITHLRMHFNELKFEIIIDKYIHDC